MLGQANPFLRTVEEGLVLPDRHLRLEVVDQPARGRERLGSVRGRCCDHYGELSESERANAVVCRQLALWKGGGNLTHHALQLTQGQRVRGVLQSLDDPLLAGRAVVVTDRAEEEHHTPGPRVLDRTQRGVHGQRGVEDGDGGMHRTNLPTVTPGAIQGCTCP
jgi:hypothetical protein